MEGNVNNLRKHFVFLIILQNTLNIQINPALIFYKVDSELQTTCFFFLSFILFVLFMNWVLNVKVRDCSLVAIVELYFNVFDETLFLLKLLYAHGVQTYCSNVLGLSIERSEVN